MDFYFFARADFYPQQLLETNLLLEHAEVTSMAKNTLSVRLSCADNKSVLLSFFGVPKLPVLRAAWQIELAGMKAMVLQKRAEAKDYLDVHALVFQAKVDLATHLAAGLKLYPPHFAPEQTLKSLCYFGDGNLATLATSVRRDLAKAVRGVDLQKLPEL